MRVDCQLLFAHMILLKLMVIGEFNHPGIWLCPACFELLHFLSPVPALHRGDLVAPSSPPPSGVPTLLVNKAGTALPRGFSVPQACRGGTQNHKPTEGFNGSQGPGYSASACLDVYSSKRKIILFIMVLFFRKHSRDYNLKELTIWKSLHTCQVLLPLFYYHSGFSHSHKWWNPLSCLSE